MTTQEDDEQEWLRQGFISLTDENKDFALRIAEIFLIMQGVPAFAQENQEG